MNGTPMNGLMQATELNLIHILEHAELNHGSQEVVSLLVDEGLHRQTYSDTARRTRQLANALEKLGVEAGDRIGTLAWNNHRHLETWYAVAGLGAICHTINPRLFEEQLEFIINHAQNRILFVDLTFAALVQKLRPRLPSVEQVVVMTARSHMPEGDWLCYEELVESEDDTIEWPALPENTASSLCYTSGTTGDPKGVLYSHRSNLLQACALPQRDVMNLGADGCVLMVVPMFHANSWGLAYAAPMIGAKLVLPGPGLDGANIHARIVEEGVTLSAAVPTIWNMLLDHLDATGEGLGDLREVIIGGSAVARSMIVTFAERYGVEVIHAWGMTEMSPVGTINRPVAAERGLDAEAILDLRCKQGRALYGVDMEIRDDEGNTLPRDGETFGRLMVRGPWIVAHYFGHENEPLLTDDGWLDTGDIATIDGHGFMEITDRAKDVIKSGGEWISSVDLENTALGHPDVSLACAIGLPHPKWEERPVLLVIPREGAAFDADGVLSLLAEKFARWQLPDRILPVEQLPMTATGKLDKKVLRAEYAALLMDG